MIPGCPCSSQRAGALGGQQPHATSLNPFFWVDDTQQKRGCPLVVGNPCHLPGKRERGGGVKINTQEVNCSTARTPPSSPSCLPPSTDRLGHWISCHCPSKRWHPS